MVLLTHNFTSEAAVCFTEAEKLDSEEPRWPYYHGIALQEDPERAIPKVQRAVHLSGDRVPPVRACLAEMLLGQDRLDEADLEFQRILKLHPGDARALLGLSRTAYRRDDLHKSLHYAQRSLDEGGAAKASRLLLAEIYQRLGDKANAEQQSRKVASLRVDPPWPDPFLQQLLELRTGERANIKRAQQLLDVGRTAQAVTLLQQMVMDYPNSATCWLMLGRALVRQQDWPAALQALKKALELAPDNPEIHVQMGVALYCQWDPRAAVHFRKAIEIQPDCAAAYYNLALWLVRIHDHAGAIDAFRRAIQIQPNLSDAYLGLGSQLARQGRIAEGVRHLQRAMELKPADPRGPQLLMQVVREMGIPIFP
jgi:tetratricopeptide (TPR) repeat protein